MLYEFLLTPNLDSFRNRKNRLFARGILFLKIMISKFYIIIAIGSIGSVVILVEIGRANEDESRS